MHLGVTNFTSILSSWKYERLCFFCEVAAIEFSF